jgi:transposase
MDVETKADRFVGIDVSKGRVDVHIRPDGMAFGCATDAEGLGRLVERLKPLSPCLVVLEASGGYEGVLAAALVEASLPAPAINALPLPTISLSTLAMLQIPLLANSSSDGRTA